MELGKKNFTKQEDIQWYIYNIKHIGRTDLQEAADLLCELEQTFFSLMQGTSDRHCQPLSDGLSIALVE